MGATLRGASPAVGISGTPLGGIGVLGGRWMLRGVGPYSSAFSCFGGKVVVIGARDTVVSVIGCDCAGCGRAIPATVARMEHMNAGSAQGDRAPVRKMYGVFCMTMTVLFLLLSGFIRDYVCPISPPLCGGVSWCEYCVLLIYSRRGLPGLGGAGRMGTARVGRGKVRELQ